MLIIKIKSIDLLNLYIYYSSYELTGAISIVRSIENFGKETMTFFGNRFPSFTISPKVSAFRFASTFSTPFALTNGGSKMNMLAELPL